MIPDTPQDMIDVCKSLWDNVCDVRTKGTQQKIWNFHANIFENFFKIFFENILETFLKIMSIATDENIYHLLDNDRYIYAFIAIHNIYNHKAHKTYLHSSGTN